MDKDYYKILRVTPAASSQEIREAYRKLALVYHPDIIKTPESNRMMAQINEAYEVLGDRKKRELYDAGRESISGSISTANRGTKRTANGIYTPEEWKRLVLVKVMTYFVMLLCVLFLWALANGKYDIVTAILIAGTLFLRKMWTIFRIESNAHQ